MLIRHRLIIWFVFFVTVVLLSFSLYIYFNYAHDRTESFQQRLERRVVGTQQLFDPNGNLKGSINNVLFEQRDLVYSSKDSLYYFNDPNVDFIVTQEFLEKVRQKGKLFFSYKTPKFQRPKDGVALAYHVSFESPTEKPYVAIVTAYDIEGYQKQEGLRDLFFIANFLCIGVIGFAAHIFSSRSLRPLDSLNIQITNHFNNSLSFRLKHFNPKDEVGSLATSFNNLLDQQERLINNQRSFISQASHELRTPMAALKGVLETALYYDSDMQTLQQSQRDAIKELDRLISLSNGLLQLARIENTEDSILISDVNLVELLMDVVDEMQVKWKTNPLQLNFSDQIVEMNSTVEIKGESTLLHAAILNLVDNACKYSFGQEVKISLDILKPNFYRLIIKDHGIGIPMDELSQITEPLYRASNTPLNSGFGIGLTLANKIMQLHGASLQIDSIENKGTSISVKFPY